MRTTGGKWGKSAAVRIPPAVMETARLDLNQPVDVREQSGYIVIEPLGRKEYDLTTLLKRITRRNLHEECDFAEPVDREVW